MRKCSRCGESKPPSEFTKQTKSTDGLCPHCKRCRCAAMAAWRAANPEKIKASAEKRVTDGRARKQSAAYRARNPDKVRAYAKRKYAENADSVKAGVRDWALRNPEKLRARKAEWRKSNQESAKASKHRNRAKRKQAEGSHTAQELRDLFEKQRGKCAVCRDHLTKAYHADHVQPIAKGGTNDILNIQLLCRVCNQTKSAKDPVVFMQERGFLL